jgi:hypothetical protein
VDLNLLYSNTISDAALSVFLPADYC